MAKNYRHFLLAGLSGFILALAYPGWGIDFGFLVWIGFVPLLYALGNVAQWHDRVIMQHCYGNCFLTGFIAGLVYFLVIFRWLWSIHPLDTMGIQSRLASSIIVLIIYVVSSAGMAAFWGLASAAFSFRLSASGKRKVLSPIFSGLFIASMFMLTEYARSFGFGLLWVGSGTLLGPHWTLGNLAYALAGNNLALKLSSYAGIYGISFAIVLVNTLLSSVLNSNKTALMNNFAYAKLFIRRGAIVATAVLALAFIPGLLKPVGQNTAKEINFAVIQTNQSTKISPTPKETLNAFKEQLDLLNRVAKEHPESQLIIFPEASDFFKNLSLFLTGSQIPNYFANLFEEPRLIIAGARIIDTDGRAYSRAFALDTKKDIVGFYDKQLLTPEGEFLSYPTKFIVNLLSKIKVSEFGELRELSIGKNGVSTVNFRGQFSVAPLVCSELLSPSLARQTTEGSDIIVGMASYGLFHGSTVLAKQNLASARFRAAENQKPLLAASNMGLSYAIDSRGNIAKITPNQAPQILTGSIALNPQKSWYNKVGDIPVLVGSLVLVVYFVTFALIRSKSSAFNV